MTPELCLFALISIALAVLDYHYRYFNTIRHYGDVLTQPLYYITKLPVDATRVIYNYSRERHSLLNENEHLRKKNLEISNKVMRIRALEHENSVLRELLQSPRKKIKHKLMVAELIGINPQPLEQKIIINKGSSDGVYVNQTVLDANGVIGQVSSLTSHSAIVTLISNPGHALMGQIRRSGIRVLVSGTGNPEQLHLLHVPASADVRIADEISSSGLDKRLPAGYPVAIITDIKKEPGDLFAKIHAKPFANLRNSTQMLLVDPKPTNNK